MPVINLQKPTYWNAIDRTDRGFREFKREGKSKVKMMKMWPESKG
jgi:hypothetical protein